VLCGTYERLVRTDRHRLSGRKRLAEDEARAMVVGMGVQMPGVAAAVGADDLDAVEIALPYAAEADLRVRIRRRSPRARVDADGCLRAARSLGLLKHGECSCQQAGGEHVCRAAPDHRTWRHDQYPVAAVMSAGGPDVSSLTV